MGRRKLTCFQQIEEEGGLGMVVAELALDQWRLIVRCLLGFCFNFLVLLFFFYLCYAFHFLSSSYLLDLQLIRKFVVGAGL